MDLLATTHSDRKGVYLWANQAVFGNPADILPSDEVISLGLPRVGGEGDEEGGGMRAVEEADSSDDEGSEDEAERNGGDERRRSSGRAADAGPQAPPPYELRDSLTGAPVPLAPELVTLSLLPASQWQSLVHLETIKARNKPIEQPKKPESAPFFLPTVPGLSGNPTFDAAAAATSASAEDAAAAFFGGGGPSSSSRVVKASFGSAAAQEGGRKRPSPMVPPFLAALRAGAPGYGPLMALLRGMSASAIDRELRAMQVLEGSDPEDQAEGVRDLAALLDFLTCQLQPSDGVVANFEFCQGLIQLALQVHGDSIMQHAELLAPARQLQAALKPAWQRVDGLMQGVRCMLSYFGNLQ
jgi:U3 small nucleolar RNA-associated protein 21